MATREHFPYRWRIGNAPRREDKSFTGEVRRTLSEGISNSARDTLMTVAQPAINPEVEIWATPEHIYFDMVVVKPDDNGEANEWRLHFNANNFRSHIRDTVLLVLTEVEAGTFEQKHKLRI